MRQCQGFISAPPPEPPDTVRSARFPSPKVVSVFHHVVLLRFSPESTPAQHRAVADALRSLPGSISEIADYDVHVDARLSAENAHVSAHGTFANETAWRAYSSHPAHVKVVDELIVPILETAVRTQYTD